MTMPYERTRAMSNAGELLRDRWMDLAASLGAMTGGSHDDAK